MKLWTVLGMVAVLGGCKCGPDECEDLFVTFESPKDGMVGVPATSNVSIKVANSAGTAIELESAQLVSRASSATEFSVPRDGTITSGAASFDAVTLEPGPNVLKVTVKKKATTCTGTKSITVEVPVTNDPPKVLTMTFPQDTAMPTGVLNSIELPSAAMMRVDITTQFANGATVDIINTANNMTLGTGMVANSVASVQFLSTALADGPYTLFAKLTRTGATNTQTGNPEAVKMITLDRTPPTCMVTSPSKALLGPTDDADSVKAGYQIRAAGSTTAKAITLEMKLSGGAVPQVSGPKAPVNLAVSQDFDVPAAGSVAYTVTGEAKDSAGNVGLCNHSVIVDFDAPSLVIVSPDGGTETSFNVPIIANVMGGNGGTVEWKVTDSIGTRDLGIFSVDAGVSASIGSFVNGAQTISATPTDAVGNVGPTVVRPFTVNATSGCSVVFTRPTTRPGFITGSQVTAGGSYSFQGTSSCVNGTMVALKRNGTTVATQAVSGGTVTWNVPVSSGTFKFRAEVGSVFDEIDVVIDLNAPAITQPFDGATINLSADAAPGTPGIQRPLAYTGMIPMGGRADICSNQVPAASGSMPCADGASGWWTLKSNVSSPDATFSFPDGNYCLKLVVVSGTTTNVSQPTCVLVDSIAPTLTGVTLLRDANTDGKLNLAELAGLAPEFRFTLGGGHVQSSISQVQVTEGATVFNTAGAVTYSGASLNVVNVMLDRNMTATTQTYSWIIELVDNAGNPGSSLVQIVKIDKVAPTCAITAPTGELGRPDDANMATAGFDLRVDVSGSPDTSSVTFGTSGGQTLTAMDSAVSGNATHTFALTQATGVVSYNLTASCVDDSGNSTAASPLSALSIDLDPPTCSMTAPIASPPPYSTLGLATSVTVGGAGTVGRTVNIFSQIGAGARTQVGSLVVAGSGVAAGTVSYNSGVQTVTAEVTDPAGNICTVPGRSIEINSAQCAIAFTSPTIGSSGRAYLTSTNFSVTGVSSNCGAGKVVELFQVGNATALGTAMTTAGGLVTINGTLAEGGPYTLRLRIDNGAALTTDTDLAPVYVDLTSPTMSSVEFNGVAYPAAGAAISFVALNNRNFLPPTPNATFVADNALGGNADFNVKVNGVTGAIGGRVRVMYQAVERATVDVTASPQDATLNGVSLPHNTSGTFQIQVLDEAGNVLQPINVPGVVDVLEPGAPAVTRGLVTARTATVNLSFMPTYDDGSVAASGAHQGYEIRWSTSTVTGNNLLATAADYHDSAKAFPESNEPWSAAAISRNLTLPPNNTYYVVVRASDEVGNYSPYSAPTPLANLGTNDVLTNPSGVSDQYGSVMASRGSLNNDAIDDLVVGAFIGAKVYVYFGGTGFATQPGCTGVACQTIGIPVVKNPATESFGNSVAVGKVSSATAPELAVGSASFNAGQGRSFLYFGGANPDAGTYVDDSVWVEFRGSAGSDFGRSVTVIPDVNGDGLGELAITARNQNGFRGRLFIFKGRSKAAWIAAAGGTFIPDSAADWVIDGPTPVTGVSNNFGLQLSISSLGALTGGVGNDITVSAANETVNEIYLVSSSVLLDAGTVTTGRASSGTPNMAFQTISRPQLGNPLATAFGGVVLAGIDVVGASAADLVTSNRKESSLFVYGDGTPTSFGSPLTIVGGANFGAAIACGDLNGDGRLDLVSSEAETAGNPNNVWVLYNRTSSFDAQVGRFFQSVFRGNSGPTGAIGTSIVVGDFDGDGSADVAVADRATNFGRVLVWH